MNETIEGKLDNIHSDIRALLHSELAFPKPGETAGSMCERLIPHLKKFIKAERKQAQREVLQELESNPQPGTVWDNTIAYWIESKQAQIKEKLSL